MHSGRLLIGRKLIATALPESLSGNLRARAALLIALFIGYSPRFRPGPFFVGIATVTVPFTHIRAGQ